MMRMAKRFELWAALPLTLLAVGCDGCKEEKPYTPFGVTSAVPDQAGSGAPAAPSASAEPGKYRPAVVAPAGSRKLRMGTLTLDAPPRYLFDRALVLGEGESQLALAWVKAEPDARDVPPGALVSFTATGERKQVMARSEERRVGKECRSRWSTYQ